MYIGSSFTIFPVPETGCPMGNTGLTLTLTFLLLSICFFCFPNLFRRKINVDGRTESLQSKHTLRVERNAIKVDHTNLLCVCVCCFSHRLHCRITPPSAGLNSPCCPGLCWAAVVVVVVYCSCCC